MRLARRCRARSVWSLTALLLVAALACEPSPRRRARPAAAAATSATTTAAPATTATAAPVAQPPGKPGAADVEGTAPVDAAALLAQIEHGGVRGTLVNVWASWCGSCRRELPMLLGLREVFRPQGLDVLFVSADERSQWPDAVAFAREAQVPLPAFVVPGSFAPFKRAMSPRWRGAIPASFLFDGKAKLRHWWEGPVYEHEVVPILQGFLAGEDIDGETRPALSAGRTTL